MGERTVPSELLNVTVDGPVVSDGGNHEGVTTTGSAVDLLNVKDNHFFVAAFSGVSGGEGVASVQGSLDGTTWYEMLSSLIVDDSNLVHTASSSTPARYLRAYAYDWTFGNGQGHATVSIYSTSE